MVVYGFRALHARMVRIYATVPSDYVRLEKSDWDILVTTSEFNTLLNSFPEEDIISIRPIKGFRYFIKTAKGNYDIHIIRDIESSNGMLYSLVDSTSRMSIVDKYGNEMRVPNLGLLFAIKKSHRFIRQNFFKTMEDYNRMLHLPQAIDYPIGFYDKRFEETMQRGIRNTRHINLDQGKEGFFTTKGVTYIYDHDSIHRAIALTRQPMYLYYLEDGKDVICDKRKWDSLSYLHKKYAVLEEAYVIALERFLTKGSSKSPHEAFMVALEKICTTLCKGWFREFAYENYLDILSMYSDDFVQKFEEAKSRGEILPYKGNQ